MTTLQKIKAAIDRRGLKTTELSQMAGLTYWQVYHTMRAKSADEAVVARLAKALGVETGK